VGLTVAYTAYTAYYHWQLFCGLSSLTVHPKWLPFTAVHLSQTAPVEKNFNQIYPKHDFYIFNAKINTFITSNVFFKFLIRNINYTIFVSFLKFKKHRHIFYHASFKTIRSLYMKWEGICVVKNWCRLGIDFFCNTVAQWATS